MYRVRLPSSMLSWVRKPDYKIGVSCEGEQKSVAKKLPAKAPTLPGASRSMYQTTKYLKEVMVNNYGGESNFSNPSSASLLLSFFDPQAPRVLKSHTTSEISS